MKQGNPYQLVEIAMLEELHRGIEVHLPTIRPGRGLLHLATALWQRRPRLQIDTARPYDKRAYELSES
ncbi:MAG: hypothetical protein IT320_07325 [Anaerolineae bacterium]|nr:hypothetical protein [Anaerolineae bacterium]